MRETRSANGGFPIFQDTATHHAYPSTWDLQNNIASAADWGNYRAGGPPDPNSFARQDNFLPPAMAYPAAPPWRAPIDGLAQPTSPAFGAKPVNGDTLGAYSRALDSVQSEINETMSVAQRSLARTLTIAGSLLALGGGVVAGVFAFTGLGAAATGIGLPAGAAAALAAVAVFAVGSLLAVGIGAVARSLVRKSLHKNPQLEFKLEALRVLRDQLSSAPTLSPGEKHLLKNTKRVLGKVEGFGNQVKSQLKLSGKTSIWATLGVVMIAVSADSVFGGGDPFGSCEDISLYNQGDGNLPVRIENGRELLEVMGRS